MRKANMLIAAIFLTSFLSVTTSVLAETFTLSSKDISQGEFMGKAQEFTGFGCSGGNLSPHLQWKDAPKGTKSFAITAYDPDAPTGSGWWHWQVVNIAANTTELVTGAGNTKKNIAPKGSIHITNDYGSRSFGGACPPKGHGIHHYRFTIHALSVEKLALPENASGALAGYMINANTIETSTIEALYKRD
jgi:Raf kinase inhibitor-like YbhB/YbcL family protein